MNKLFLDTSTQALILILYQNDDVVDYLFDESKNNHSEKLMSSIEMMLNKNKMTIKMIDAFYVTEGPGSYTGVRIGVTVAKTLAYTLNKPLYKISSLKVIAASYLNEFNFLVPLIDARRGNAFASLYEVKEGKLVNKFEDSLYNVETFIHDIKNKVKDKVLICGIDSEKFKDIIKEDQFIVSPMLKTDFKPENIVKLEFEQVKNIHAFVPNYKRLPEAELNLL
ncbi:MAG: tRNA ((37)-N6)-threonylcarbamoyltransferase complex dimerization subunit type 1 TsaB [Haloplasmataceae bacterium]|jgi:tRNA threonylcarbamoyladenosine biosynthesis protein TsaB|nr:tRNA ((37)-N6)-threonylcarbamoyltransferase complex dimerization subunit type 1 TsaB [Haloplasmataceae bacterium]